MMAGASPLSAQSRRKSRERSGTGFYSSAWRKGERMAAKPKLQPMPAPSPARIRCAIYTRKSTDEGLEQDFNTLDAQREAGEAFIASQRHEGWVALSDRY